MFVDWLISLFDLKVFLQIQSVKLVAVSSFSFARSIVAFRKSES